jgi:hypothetical protein
MENIDITSSEFSLGNLPEFNNNLSDSIINGGSEGNNNDNMYMYIAIALLVITIGIFIYKFYFNKQRHVHFNDVELDCPGGFCTMGSQE